MRKLVFISLSLIILSACAANRAVQGGGSPLSTDETEGAGKTKAQKQAERDALAISDEAPRPKEKSKPVVAESASTSTSTPVEKKVAPDSKPVVQEEKKSKKRKKNEPEVAPVQAAAPTPVKASTDSLFVTLERTPCFGHCPSYKIEIYLRGYVVYHGYNYVDHTGDYYTKISKDQMKQIFDFAKEIKYFNLKDSYINTGLTDFPTTVTSMNIKGNKKSIVNGHSETPSELIFFEKLIDDMFKDTEWKPIKK